VGQLGNELVCSGVFLSPSEAGSYQETNRHSSEVELEGRVVAVWFPHSYRELLTPSS